MIIDIIGPPPNTSSSATWWSAITRLTLPSPLGAGRADQEDVG
jgi:hypothetical protein